MAVLTEPRWRGEPLKAEIYFLSSMVYSVTTNAADSPSGNFIKNIRFHISEGNSNVNPLGVAASNSIDMEIYDGNDYLSPMNQHSPYYGLAVNGVKVKLYISYNGVSWSNYGEYYTTFFGGSFTEGWHGLASISAEDKVNTIGNYNLPSIPVYVDVKASQLIASVMSGVGIMPSEYRIDSRIDKTISYGTLAGNKMRDFLNNICQLLLARVIIDRDGIICFVPALELYSGYNELTIGSEYTGGLQNKNNSNVNYSRIDVKYLVQTGSKQEVVYTDTDIRLSSGLNIINDLLFDKKVLDIEQVKLIYDSSDSGASVTSMVYSGAQTGIKELRIYVDGGGINGATLEVEGSAISTVERYLSMPVNINNPGGIPLVFDTQQMLDVMSANDIASDIYDYLQRVSRNVIISGTALTPRLWVGDKLTISGTGTMYDGSFKIIAIDLSVGEDYELSCELIRM